MSAATSNVIRLGSRFACPLCGRTGTWRLIGKGGCEQRSCDDDIAAVARQIPTDGFTPLCLIPVFPVGGDVCA